MQRFARLDAPTRSGLLSRLTDGEKAALAYRWEGWFARPDQLPPAVPWRYWLILAGRGYGKTRVGAEELRKAARRIRFPNIIGATADDARDIMIEGESGILAVCPPWERPVYNPSRRQLSWPNGAKTLVFTADEPERLRGKQHEWLWADELAAWRYPEAWDQAMLGLRLGENPQAVVTTTPKPTPLVRELVANPICVVTRGSTYDNVDNLAQAFADEIIRKYEGTRLGRQELLGELLEGEGLAYSFSERIHVVPPFLVPDGWDRFEGFDYGWTSPSGALAFATDYAGNVIVFDGLYRPGLPSEIAPLLRRKREQWWCAKTPAGVPVEHSAWADPSMFNKSPTSKFGQPYNAADEFHENGIHFARANNDRRAGYLRIAEMLKLNMQRRLPKWHPDADTAGSPRLFVFDVPGTVPLREQLQTAPLEEAEPGPNHGPHPGEAVAHKWESSAHHHAALRYGLMSKPSPSAEPAAVADDPRRAYLDELEQRERDHNENVGRYQAV